MAERLRGPEGIPRSTLTAQVWTSPLIEANLRLTVERRFAKWMELQRFAEELRRAGEELQRFAEELRRRCGRG
jgi:uncharacterized protein YeaO (DUF488 family)